MAAQYSGASAHSPQEIDVHIDENTSKNWWSIWGGGPGSTASPGSADSAASAGGTFGNGGAGNSGNAGGRGAGMDVGEGEEAK